MIMKPMASSFVMRFPCTQGRFCAKKVVCQVCLAATPDGSKDQCQGDFARFVQQQHSDAFAKLKTMKPTSKRAVPSKVPAEVLACKVCNAKKHSCAWCYCSEGKRTKTKGGSCYCCYQATRLLQCSRSVELLRSSGVIKVVVVVSARVRANKGEADKCGCYKCTSAASASV